MVLLRVINPKMGYPKNILVPKNILTPSNLDFLGQDPVNWNWGPILVFNEKYHFWGVLRVKNSKMGYPKNILAPKVILGYPILGFLTLKSTKKWFVLIRNITKLAIFQHATNFVMFLIKTNNFLVLLRVKNPKMEYLKHILGPKNILTPSKLDFLGQDPVNWNWGPILVFDEKCHFFGTFKGQKS